MPSQRHRIEHPRNLIAVMKWLGILSEGEARAAIRDYRGARDGVYARDLLRFGGGEAVCHGGGPEHMIRRAVEIRATVRRLQRDNNPRSA